MWRSDTGTLAIAAFADVDSEIRIEAKAEEKCAYLTVKVVKIPVERVEIVCNKAENTVTAGASLLFGANVYPQNASFDTVRYSVNSSYASLTQGGLLTVREDAPEGLRILVTATSEDDPAVFDSCEVQVVKRAVQSVALLCKSSFKITQSLVLRAQVLPQNATYPQPSFRIVSATAQGAKISGNVLYASGTGEITIEAVADGVASAPVVVRAEKEPVTGIRFDAPAEIFAGDYVPLQACVLTANATCQAVVFRIEENNAAAEIDGNVLYAGNAGTVRVCAYADGITQSVRITVHENAGANAQTPALLWTGETRVKVNSELRLAAAVYPAHAATGAVRYEIVRGENARLYGGNILRAEREGTVTVRASAGGLTCETEITVEKEPVRDIVFAVLPFKHASGLPLTAQVLPQNATYPAVTYEVEDDSGNAYILSGVLYARRPGTVRLRATADGFTKVFEVQAIKQAVTQIVFGDTGRIVLNESYRTGAIEPVVTVLPQNATYASVTYEIVNAANCNARLENGVLRVTLSELLLTPLGYARDVQASVTVRATADGVFADRTYTVYKSPVTGIVLDQSVQTAQNEWIAQSERRFKTSGSMLLTVRILQEWA
ncbi:MAG: hypothetical protein K2L51_07055, partial [Clostridiales bacterium]|nr:hypothetical protein [Clostridiales bacterium]